MNTIFKFYTDGAHQCESEGDLHGAQDCWHAAAGVAGPDHPALRHYAARQAQRLQHVIDAADAAARPEPQTFDEASYLYHVPGCQTGWWASFRRWWREHNI